MDRKTVLAVAAARRGLVRFRLAEIARRAGVSQSMVQIVIDGRPGASPETRRRVEDVIGHAVRRAS
jgi:hypothetical protein